MNKYLLHGKMDSAEGNTEKLVSILISASNLLSSAKGCIAYLVSKDDMEKNSVWITEIWDSKEDHDESLNIKGVKELISQAIPLLKDRPQKGQELTGLGGKGI